MRGVRRAANPFAPRAPVFRVLAGKSSQNSSLGALKVARDAFTLPIAIARRFGPLWPADLFCSDFLGFTARRRLFQRAPGLRR